MASIVVGLDLSLAATGMVRLAVGADHIEGELAKLVKSKPTEEKSPTAEMHRLLTIKEEIRSFLEIEQPDLVAIEGLAFMARNTTALVQLAGLSYLVREWLVLKRIHFVIVAPTTLKKFIVGKGNAQKDLMMMETYKRYDRTYTDNNECDAHALAQVCLALRGDNTRPLTAFQEQVVNLLKIQYEKNDEEGGNKKASKEVCTA